MSRIGFDAVLDGADICIEFERHTRWSTDHHWGADADGNRGISVTEIDEDFAVDITVTTFIENGDGAREVVTALVDMPEGRRAAVQELVDKWLEEHEPNEPEEPDYEYEPDYGDANED